MKLSKYLLYLFLLSIIFVSCTKYSELSSNSGSGSTTTTGTTTVDTAPRIKFYDAMDYGSMDVKLNGTKVTSIARFYPSTYFNAKEGTNTISLNFPNKSDVLNTTLDLVRNSNYSCFFYMVGNEWKYNLVKDNIKTTPPSGYANVRILDFRTEAYYNYINVRMSSPGGSDIDQKNRNFLDHVTYSGYTNYQQVIAGTYNFYFYNDTMTASRRLGVPIDSKGIYTVMLTTPGNITPYTEAIKYIFPDVVKHN